MKMFKKILFLCLFILIGFVIYQFVLRYLYENVLLKKIVARLEAESRIAEVLVTKVTHDESTKTTSTTIKFLEYDSQGKPLFPKYFTFAGNVIQFQSLVIRFENYYIRMGDPIKGKSAYLFWKVFRLDKEKTEEYEIARVNSIPDGYKLEKVNDPFEEWVWKKFWSYALNPEKAKEAGIKNAQIEAPGTMFVPGMLYTIKIEHDGGLRIDSAPLPSVLRGEQIPP